MPVVLAADGPPIVRVEVIPPPPPPVRVKGGFGSDDLIGFGVAAAAICYASMVARRRRSVPAASPRGTRVTRAVAVAAFPVAIMVFVTSFSRTPAEPGQNMLRGLTAGGLIGLIYLFEFWLIDVVLGRLRPFRSWGWLAAAAVVFSATMMTLPIAAALTAGRTLSLLRWESLILLLFTQAAAIIWWAHLPDRGRSLAEVFR